MRSWAIRLGTNFRSRLVRDYVKEGLNACDTYPFINGDHWDEFVEIKTSKKFLVCLLLLFFFCYKYYYVYTLASNE